MELLFIELALQFGGGGGERGCEVNLLRVRYIVIFCHLLYFEEIKRFHVRLRKDDASEYWCILARFMTLREIQILAGAIWIQQEKHSVFRDSNNNSKKL